MSILGTLQGIGAGDPMGSFMKSNQAAIDQAGANAAGKAIMAMFNPQVPGAQPMGGPPIQVPQGATQPPSVPPMPPGGPQPYAQAGPQQPSIPGAQPMPGAGGAPQGPGGGPGPVAGAGQPNPQLAQAQQQQQQLKAQLAQLQAQRGGGQPPGQPQPGAPQQPQQPQQPGQPQQQIIQGLQQSQGQLDWRGLVQQVVQANPGATPEVIAAAVNKLIPLMNAQSLSQWRQIQAQLGMGRLEETTQHHVVGEEQAGQRISETAAHHEVTEGQGEKRIDIQQGAEERRTRQGDRRLDQTDERIAIAKTREGRLDRQAQARNDQKYQELALRRKGLENQWRKTHDGETGRRWRASLEAEYQYTRTIIGSAQLSGKERQKLLDQNEAWHDEQIRKLRESEVPQDKINDRFPTPAESFPAAQ